MSGILMSAGSGSGVFLDGPLTASKSQTTGPPDFDPVDCTAGFQLANDGILYKAQTVGLTPSWFVQSTGWLSSGDASSYDVRFTRTSGTTPASTSGSCTSGTWYNLATSRHVGYSETTASGTWTIDIALSTDHTNILATATATINVN